MTNHPHVPVDGYIEAQDTWLKSRRRSKSQAKKKRAPQPNWGQVFQKNLSDVPGYAYAVAHRGRLVAEGAFGVRTNICRRSADTVDHDHADQLGQRFEMRNDRRPSQVAIAPRNFDR